MSFTRTFAKSNKVYEAANNFASCSCSASKSNNNALFSDIALVAVSVFLFLTLGLLCLRGVVEGVLLNLIALIILLKVYKFMRKSQSA